MFPRNLQSEKWRSSKWHCIFSVQSHVRQHVLPYALEYIYIMVSDTAPLNLVYHFFYKQHISQSQIRKEMHHKIINLLNTNYQHKGKTIKAAVAVAVPELWDSSSSN